MKYLATILLIVFLGSCEKEREFTIQDYIGTYVVESEKTMKIYNRCFGVCLTGLDSIEIHISDSLRNLQPDFSLDTILQIDTIRVIPSESSLKEITVIGLMDGFVSQNDSITFYNPDNSKDLLFLNSNFQFNGLNKETRVSKIGLFEIMFDFACTDPWNPITFTYKGKAKRIF